MTNLGPDLPPGLMKGDVNWDRVFARSGEQWQREAAAYFEHLKGQPVRDPNRIDEIISELAAYWHAHPDMRLGQIISNATPQRFSEVITERHGHQKIAREPFYVEDDEMLEGIKNLP